MKLISASVLSLVVVLLVLSCSKDSKPSAAETNAVTLAGAKGSSKVWMISTLSLSTNGAAAQDLTSTSNSCFLDNTYTFTNNATQDYEYDEGASKCNSSDSYIIEKGSWAFTDDGKTLLVDGTPYSSAYFLLSIGKPLSILNLTSASFTATFTYLDSLNNTNLVSMNFVKK
jgi:hypothetical protein